MLSSLFTYKVAEIRVIDGNTIEAQEVTDSEKAEGLKSKTALRVGFGGYLRHAFVSRF